MCAVSMIGDHYGQKWSGIQYPLPPSQPQPVDQGQAQSIGIGGLGFQLSPYATQAQVEELKREVIEMKELLKRAIAYDERTQQPGCENEAKIKFLREVAAAVGVSLDDLFGPKPAQGTP